jgi:hypothetical protein
MCITFVLHIEHPNCLHAKRFVPCKITSAATCVFMCIGTVRIKTSFLHARSPVRMNQLVSHWAGYSEILYWRHETISKGQKNFKIGQK